MTKLLVTGAGGFVGTALVKELLAEGNEVVGVGRKDIDSNNKNFKFIKKDLREGLTIEELEGVEGVFHVASKVDMWGDYAEFFSTNVLATEKLIEVCKISGVKALVYTSSPSVIANGKDLINVDETISYPEHYNAYYPQTKAIAEKMVLSADTEEGLRTMSLRPHLIFGPGDTNLVPIILEKAKSGKLNCVGDGSNLADFCFIYDCVRAHILGMKALLNDGKAAGKPYFISQGEPYPLWEFVNEVLKRSNLNISIKKIPIKLAKILATIFETKAAIFGGEPRITRFLVEEMCTHHYFNISSAKNILGYNPAYSMKEAMEITFNE